MFERNVSDFRDRIAGTENGKETSSDDSGDLKASERRKITKDEGFPKREESCVI